MHGLVSLLPAPHYQNVEALWQELEAEHGLQGIKVTPYPHFSWQIAQEYDFPGLEAILHDIARRTPAFMVHTAGIGMFSGPRPVIFIPVVKSRQLMDFHAELWAATQPVSQGRSIHYAPENWMPHISLAYEDVDEHNVVGVMQKLAFRSFAWQMQVDNLSVIHEADGDIGQLRFSLPLQIQN